MIGRWHDRRRRKRMTRAIGRASTIARAFDPAGTNVALTRVLLQMVLEDALEMDPAHAARLARDVL